MAATAVILPYGHLIPSFSSYTVGGLAMMPELPVTRADLLQSMSQIIYSPSMTKSADMAMFQKGQVTALLDMKGQLGPHATPEDVLQIARDNSTVGQTTAARQTANNAYRIMYQPWDMRGSRSTAQC